MKKRTVVLRTTTAAEHAALVDALTASGLSVAEEGSAKQCIFVTMGPQSFTVEWSSRELPLSLSPTIAPADLATVLVVLADLDVLQCWTDLVVDQELAGLTTAVIAHDANNALMAMVHAASQLEKVAAPGVGELAGQIMEGANQIAALMRRIMVRQRAAGGQMTNVNAVLGTLVPLLRTIAGVDVQVTTRLEEPLPLVMVDPLDLERLVINLVTNGRDAMPDGGRLTISTAVARVGPEDATDAPRGRWVLVEVEDGGCGIDEATRAQVFDPFFTTKPSGRGTGLGLTSVLRVVRGAAGHVRIRSVPGNGTRVSVFLPLVARAAGAPSGAE